MKFNNLKEVFDYLDTINDPEFPIYDDCKEHSYIDIEGYQEILKKVLEDKPKRVIDVGSNLNQYGFLFANEGIEYIGIDCCIGIECLEKEISIMQPIITDKIKFIHANYEDVADYFKDDVIISCLCIGYLIPYNKVKAKRLIVNGLKDGKETAFEISKKELEMIEVEDEKSNFK